MSHNHAQGDDHVHETPFWTMFWCLMALLFLTVLTALTAHYIDIGPLNFPLAMLIACTKALLVFGFFMHLFYDKLINTVVVISCLFAVTLFIGISILDLTSRDRIDRIQAGEVTPGGTNQIVQKAIDAGHAKEHDAEHHDDGEGESDGEGDSMNGGDGN